MAEAARTQGGISEAIGSPQNVVSPIVRRLVVAVLSVGLRHVQGQDGD